MVSGLGFVRVAIVEKSQHLGLGSGNLSFTGPCLFDPAVTSGARAMQAQGWAEGDRVAKYGLSSPAKAHSPPLWVRSVGSGR